MRIILVKMTSMNTSLVLRPLALLAGAGLLATACASGANTGTAAQPDPTTSAAMSDATPSPPAVDSGVEGSRVALTYDGGLLVLDGQTLDVAADLPLTGFNRINAAGDGRYIMVSTAEGFRVLDAGTAVGGDTGGDPSLTDVVFTADAPGHVVRHAGRTVLFADGTGEITAFDTDALSSEQKPATDVTASEQPHHGVAIELRDGSLLSTLGSADGRTGVRLLDPSGTEVARNEECPSVHGEGTLEGEVVVFGCSDGVLVFKAGTFTKLTAPDEYGRTGNAYVSETSSLAVGDYNSNPDSEGYLLSELALIDPAAASLNVVDLPQGIEYTWRGVGRGPADEAVLLSADGTLNSIDPATGTIEKSWDIIAPWAGPVEWQDPHPALAVHGSIGYVTEPANKRIVAIDLTTGDILADKVLPATPNEIAIATG